MTISKLISTTLLSTLSLFAGVHGGHWGYEGQEGPDHWGELSESYRMCASGKYQSPIDISPLYKTSSDPLKVHYTSSTTKIMNNGHTIKVEVGSGSAITIGEKRYELKQFHFHTPSENLIDGKSFIMEAHFVHASKEGDLAVIGVMFNAGKENAQIAELWKNAPAKPGESTNFKIDDAFINALLPKDKTYYRFDGSLTTPPCSEGVLWTVLQHPLEVSNAQAKKLKHLMHGSNNRPVQSRNNRVVIED